jgi:hypothetical protein
MTYQCLMSGARQSETLVRVGTVRRIYTDVFSDECRRWVVRVSLTMSAIRPLAPKLGHPVSLINRSRATACSEEATLYVREIEPFWAVGPSPPNGHRVGELQSKRRIK